MSQRGEPRHGNDARSPAPRRLRMSTLWRVWIAALALAAGVACSRSPAAAVDLGHPAPAERPALGPRYRGAVVLGHEVRTFTPCDATEVWWLVPTPELRAAYAALSRAAYDPVYVEVRGERGPAPKAGFAADHDAQLTVRELLRAAPAAESHGCNEDLRGIVFRAAGNEPFWQLEIRPDALVLERLGAPAAMRHGPTAEPEGTGWAYTGGSSTDPAAPEIRVRLQPAPCSDTMVGTRYSWQAAVDFGGQTFSGCAWAGDRAPEPKRTERGQTPP